MKDWASWVANAKWKSEAERASARRTPSRIRIRARSPDSVSYLKMQSVLRMVVLKVMYENKIDVFVNPEQTTPPYKLGGPGEPEVNDRPTISCCTAFTALLGGPGMEVPAGYTQIAYEPQYVLAPDKKNYIVVTGDVESKTTASDADQPDVLAGPGSDPW